MLESELLTLLRDGAILSALGSAYVMTALHANPRIFLRNYPKSMRDRVPPQSLSEKRTARLIGLPFLLMLFIGPILAAVAFDMRHDGMLGFGALWTYAFGVSMIFNLVDFVILDVLWLGIFPPRWAVLPGLEGVWPTVDVYPHFRGFIVGTFVSAVSAASAAGVASLM